MSDEQKISPDNETEEAKEVTELQEGSEGSPKPATKTCKYCGSEIPESAKVCPHCRKKQKHTGRNIFLIILGILVLIMVASCIAGGNSNSSTSNNTTTSTQTETDENAEVKDYIAKANTFYAESSAAVQAFSDQATTDNYAEQRQNLMDTINDLQQRVQEELNKIPEDTTDPGLKLARQALDTDNNICLALYTTLSLNDPSGTDMVKQYIEEYNALIPELEKYQ